MLRNVPPFVRLVWQTHRGLTLAMVALRLVRAFVPVAVLWVGKLIVDEVVALRGAGGADLSRLWRLVAFEITRARGHYAAALPGIAMLPGASRACVKAAYVVYGAILDEIERLDHDVFARRAVVPAARRAALLARALLAR